jgi:NAD(P)-dependent dehydrogenase (short-subunit alcohol dehydrogenase family)
VLLEDKNAVIYGGGGKVGGAVARAFAREGPRSSSPVALWRASRRWPRRSRRRTSKVGRDIEGENL